MPHHLPWCISKASHRRCLSAPCQARWLIPALKRLTEWGKTAKWPRWHQHSMCCWLWFRRQWYWPVRRRNSGLQLSYRPAVSGWWRMSSFSRPSYPVNIGVLFAGNKADNCHISSQASHGPKLPMDEVCAFAHTPMVNWQRSLFSCWGENSTGEFEQICLYTLFWEIRAKITKFLTNKRKKSTKTWQNELIFCLFQRNYEVSIVR